MCLEKFVKELRTGSYNKDNNLFATDRVEEVKICVIY